MNDRNCSHKFSTNIKRSRRACVRGFPADLNIRNCGELWLELSQCHAINSQRRDSATSPTATPLSPLPHGVPRLPPSLLCVWLTLVLLRVEEFPRRNYAGAPRHNLTKYRTMNCPQSRTERKTDWILQSIQRRQRQISLAGWYQ